MFLIIIGVVAVAALGGLAYAEWKMPPKALLAMTAAGALVIIPYTLQKDPDVDVVMNPATGRVETVINGINTTDGTLHVDVGASNTINASTGELGIKLIDGDPESYMVRDKVDRTQGELAEAGVETDQVQLDDMPGFRRYATGLVVRPRPGETPEQTRARVREVLGAQKIETKEGSAEAFGIVGSLTPSR
jgi:hypothetical protein